MVCSSPSANVLEITFTGETYGFDFTIEVGTFRSWYTDERMRLFFHDGDTQDDTVIQPASDPVTGTVTASLPAGAVVGDTGTLELEITTVRDYPMSAPLDLHISMPARLSEAAAGNELYVTDDTKFDSEVGLSGTDVAIDYSDNADKSVEVWLRNFNNNGATGITGGTAFKITLSGFQYPLSLASIGPFEFEILDGGDNSNVAETLNDASI